MKRALSFIRVLTVAVVSAAAPAAAQQVVLERDSPLYSEPRLESARVAELKQGAAAEVLGKQGAWLRVKTPDAVGWLFSFNVRFQSKASEAGEGGGGAVLGRLFGPRRSVAVTSTIGIRGLEEEDLRQARFDAGQMKLLESYAASKEAAERAARAAGLAPRRLEYFEARP